MDFRIKCFIQHVLSHMPFNEHLNYFFQKYITRNLPANRSVFLKKVEYACRHFESFIRHTTTEKSNISYFEFGAGWDLVRMRQFGVYSITCIDIRINSFFVN